MEIQARKYFIFWALTSTTFLHLLFNFLDKTDFSSSSPPLLLSIVKHSLAFTTCHSSSYALIFRQELKLDDTRRYFWAIYGTAPIFFYETVNTTIVWGVLLCAITKFSAFSLRCIPQIKLFSDRYSLMMIVLFLSSDLYAWYFPISTLLNCALLINTEMHIPFAKRACVGVHMMVETSLFLVRGRGEFFPFLILFASFLTSACWAAVLGFRTHTYTSWDESSKDEIFWEVIMPIGEKAKRALSILKEMRKGKMIGFSVAVMGSFFFQRFLRFKSFDHVMVFLCLAVVCLANMALLRVEDDLGFFGFLMGNVVVACGASDLGLGGTTLVACGTCLALYGVRLKVESLRFESRDGGDTEVVVLLENESKNDRSSIASEDSVDMRSDEPNHIVEQVC